MVKYHFITYATDDHRIFAEHNKYSALNVGKFDEAKIYSFNDIDENFKIKNEYFFGSKNIRGAGYWIWKPYIILKKLLEIEEGDILCYNDSKYIWLKDIRVFANDILSDKNIGTYYNKPNYNVQPAEKYYSKIDSYILMNVPMKKINQIKESPQVWAGFILLKKNFETIRFISEWLTYVQDYRISSDIKSIFSREMPEFKENRHDQTTLSILLKLWEIKMHYLDKTYLLDMRNPAYPSLVPPNLSNIVQHNNHKHSNKN